MSTARPSATDHIGDPNFTVEYDPQSGRVQQLYFDPSGEDMTDDDLAIVVRSFEA